MMPVERVTRALYAAAAALLLLGLALRAAPAPAGAGGLVETRSPQAAVSLPAVPGDATGVTAAIVDGNLFSVSRAAPRVRYTPPDLAPAPPAPTGRRSPPPTRLRLLGTVVGPSGTAALIDADPAVRGAEIYRVGDLVDGRRIVAVSESTVVLEGGSGRTVLRLRPGQSPTR